MAIELLFYALINRYDGSLTIISIYKPLWTVIHHYIKHYEASLFNMQPTLVSRTRGGEPRSSRACGAHSTAPAGDQHAEASRDFFSS